MKSPAGCCLSCADAGVRADAAEDVTTAEPELRERWRAAEDEGSDEADPLAESVAEMV